MGAASINSRYRWESQARLYRRRRCNSLFITPFITRSRGGRVIDDIKLYFLMRPKKKRETPLQTIEFHVDSTLLTAINLAADKMGGTRAALVRIACIEYLKRFNLGPMAEPLLQLENSEDALPV